MIPIVIPASLVMFKGRAVDAAGTPLSKTSLVLTCRYDRGSSGKSIELGEGGEFLLAMPHIGVGKRVEISAQVRDRFSREAGLTTRLGSKWTTTAGVNDLGDLEFAPAPLLLSGRLVTPPDDG